MASAGTVHPARATDVEFRHLPDVATTWLRRSLYAAARFLVLVGGTAVMLSVFALVLVSGK